MFSNKSFDEFSKIVKESLQKRAASLIESEEFQSSILIKEFEDAEDQKKPALTRQELLRLLGTATYYNEIMDRVVSDEDIHSDIEDSDFAEMYSAEFADEDGEEEMVPHEDTFQEYEDHVFDGDVSESVELSESDYKDIFDQSILDDIKKEKLTPGQIKTLSMLAKSQTSGQGKIKKVVKDTTDNKVTVVMVSSNGFTYTQKIGPKGKFIDESVEQLEELSNETLASYKKKAGEQSSKANAEGNYKKADKRFSGIVKATKKQFANDMKKEEVELEEKELTPAELKKREEVAKAIEKKNPDMPMDKKMAVATSVAKKVAESEDKPMKHRVGVTVSDPHSDSVSKRKETVYKIVKLSAESKEHAVERAKQHYKKKGYKVHDAFHINHVNESEELSESKNISLSMVSKLMGDTKTKNQAVEKVAARFKISKEEAAKYVDQVIDKEMNEELSEGYVVRYNNPKSEQHGSEKHFDSKDAAQKHADRGNSVDKVGGKYSVHKTNAKGHEVKEDVEYSSDYKLSKDGRKIRSHRINHNTNNNNVNESEQLDELSKTTLGSYIKKASKERGWAGMEAPNNTEHGKVAKETMKKRQRGLEKAVDRLTKEEVEQLDELSKTTLSSYTKKASLDAISQGMHAGAMAQRGEKGDGEKFNKSYDKAVKRLRGIGKATDRLTKEDCMSTATRKTFKQFKEEAKKDPCWDGYEQVGMKEKDGKKVPNCVPKESK